MVNYKIAALLACHNRCEKTLACLESLFAIIHDIDVYLVDDDSVDGTTPEVHKRYPTVHVIQGDGNLFWSRGMYVAWKKALTGKYDYYLWLNDDVELCPFFFEELMACYQSAKTPCVISGIIEDKITKVTIYGGADENGKLVSANGYMQEIVHMNGNVVLVPNEVVDIVGIIDPKFHHDLGDVDYGLRLREAGLKVYVTRKAIALGYANNYCRVRKWNTTLLGRFRRLYSPLGANAPINFYFRKKHFGFLNAITYFVYLHVINILPDNMVYYFWGNTYRDE